MNTQGESRSGMWAAMGSVLAAVAASACCWLPLLLLSFGASAAGLSATFEKFRPLFLGLTAASLATGFYLVYFRKQACAPGSGCAAPNPKLQRFNRAMLWFAGALVLVFAAFPNYAGLIANPGEFETNASPDTPMLQFRVQGMTCEACSMVIVSALETVPGVLEASVSFDEKLASIRLDPDSPASRDALMGAVEETGYALTDLSMTRTTGGAQ